MKNSFSSKLVNLNKFQHPKRVLAPAIQKRFGNFKRGKGFSPDCEGYFGIECQGKRKSLPYPELEVPSCKDDLQGRVVRNYGEPLTNQLWQSAVKKNPLYQQSCKGRIHDRERTGESRVGYTTFF